MHALIEKCCASVVAQIYYFSKATDSAESDVDAITLINFTVARQFARAAREWLPTVIVEAITLVANEWSIHFRVASYLIVRAGRWDCFLGRLNLWISKPPANMTTRFPLSKAFSQSSVMSKLGAWAMSRLIM